ncbi:MAG: type I 3-dehydroquinate dehydratase [Termitinemataceae bacterium]|nr:MAG: type I 3-dehydroquinate dehydratase [Termitinemataceae bacterium]
MTRICLCLTGKTIASDLELLNKYRDYIDVAELRVDHLNADERFYIRRFPELAGLPVILTIRRKIDGGLFELSESSRVTLLSQGLAYAKPDKRCNFAYVDLEEDINIPSLEEVARAFDTRIIRSFHNLKSTDPNIISRIRAMSHVGDEILKAAVTPTCLDDVTKVFSAAKELKDCEKIIISMGDMGVCTRILANKIGSYLTYTAPRNELNFPGPAQGQLDPKELSEVFRFKKIDDKTAIYGITGYPLQATASPQFFNSVFARTNRNAVYLRFPADSIRSFIQLADELNMFGASVTIPHKETLLDYLTTTSDEVKNVGACNTIVRSKNGWSGYNADTTGFSSSLLNFIGKNSFKGMRVTMIGAGGAARAVAAELFRLKAKVIILNRNINRAEELAQKYKFEFNTISDDGIKRMNKYSDIIIQTTSVGMEPNIENDPLLQYRFTGKEIVMDIIYKPAKTHFLNRAAAAGCRIINGYDMFMRQAKMQYYYFTGENYPEDDNKAKTPE